MVGTDVLVTGGAGFIGSWFCEALLASDLSIRIVCLDKLTYCTSTKTVNWLRDTFGARFELEKADIAEAASLDRVATKYPNIQSVIHFAAESFVDKSFENPELFVRTNVVGTLNLLSYARHQHVKQVIHVSTDEVYGETFNATENTALTPTNPYSATKAGAEMLVQAYFKSWGVPAITVRCCNVYGPRQYPEKIVPLFCRALTQEPPQPCVLHGNGLNRRRYLFAEDAADALILLFEKGIPGVVYNIGSGEESELQNRQVLDTLIRLADLKCSPDGLIIYGEDRVYNDIQYSMACDRIEALGWKPKVTLEDGLLRCLQWQKRNASWFSD